MALAHAIPNAVEAAYRRGDLFEKRRKLMEAWAEYCCRNKSPSLAVSIRCLAWEAMMGFTVTQMRQHVEELLTPHDEVAVFWSGRTQHNRVLRDLDGRCSR